MKLHIDCVPCLCNQVLKAVRLLRPRATDTFIKQTLNRVMNFLQRDDLLALPAPKVGQGVYRIIGEELGNPNPYAPLKKLTNEQAFQFESRARDLIRKSNDRLATALKLAIIGNSIDFAAYTSVNIDKEMQDMAKTSIAKDESPSLFSDLTSARRILYIGDNSGEIVFDKLFIEEMLRQYPDKKIIFAVRGGPIINDVTMEDAQEVGLDQIVPIVCGSQSPGVLLEESSAEFLTAFREADLILLKGQGNFEALANESNLPTKGHIYFLLKAKCRVMERIFNKPVGSLIVSKFL
ncbi:MAG: hypothetical protein RBG13Loki_1769 [Promethearchaeota archaeon CR_4]|nr:MAG: hypothetical protein RBG13Loki_1769 [Candidatus Lokiarchaeota archaeon CR_4]